MQTTGTPRAQGLFSPLLGPPPHPRRKVSIASIPFRAPEEHLCPLPPLGRWQEPVGWRCPQPHICHIVGGDGVRAPSTGPVTSLTDTSGWGCLPRPAPPPLPTTRHRGAEGRASLWSWRFSSRVRWYCRFAVGIFIFPRHRGAVPLTQIC